MLQTRIKNRLIRRGIVALALLATLPGIPVAAGQTFDEAVAAYGRGDYATAVRGFLVYAEQGNASAQFNLGDIYREGRGVLKDHAEAARWFRLAAEQGHAEAQNKLGVIYQDGNGVLKNMTKAAHWFRRAAEQGHVIAQVNLAMMNFLGDSVPQNFVLAHMWSNIASANGFAPARRFRDTLELGMTPAEISRATELARACMISDYQDCEP